MKSPRIEVITQPHAGSDLVRFHFKGSRALPAVSESEFSGGKLSTCLLRDGTRRVLHVGLGEESKRSADGLRQACGLAVKALLKMGAEHLTFDLRNDSEFTQAAVEGAVIAAYRFEDFKSQNARRKNHFQSLRIWVSSGAAEQATKAAEVGRQLAEATNRTRHVGNQPPNLLNPQKLASEAQSLAQDLRIRCKVWDEKALKKGGFGGILAVGQGSANPPRLIVLDCPPVKKTSRTPVVAVVGKAITFDTGGISIKPADRMEEMKWDKMGGCAVLGIVQAVRALQLPVHLIGLIPSAENMPSANAYRPSDLVTTWDGKVIEVLNTDAEGRVVLADALSYARETYRPDLIIDLATLTGACVVALGSRRAGLFTDDETLRRQFYEVGESTGDRVWPLPMGEEYDDQIRSDVGLVKNTGGREGGACTAASFLRHWAGFGKWVHLDIAGPAMGGKELPHLEKGATGFGVRLVTEFLRRHAQSLTSR